MLVVNKWMNAFHVISNSMMTVLYIICSKTKVAAVIM